MGNEDLIRRLKNALLVRNVIPSRAHKECAQSLVGCGRGKRTLILDRWKVQEGDSREKESFLVETKGFLEGRLQGLRKDQKFLCLV
ncbi:hypothetical protein Fmac_028453 [Flemingia macrophylla]|uniref:Uncharacterized protein n=1 Tax=Flemingia macrophylla TaxID=520843 RepID=A0ABD1L7J6_9FABA